MVELFVAVATVAALGGFYWVFRPLFCTRRREAAQNTSGAGHAQFHARMEHIEKGKNTHVP